jgi:Alginate export
VLVSISAVILGIASASVSAARAEEGETAKPSALDQALDAIIGGKPILDVNLRWENAKADTFQTSNALTVRTRLGYQTKPLYGVSGLLEFENTATPLPSGYFDGVEGNDTRQTIVADPEVTAANRFWLDFQKPEWAGLKLKTGRQRVKLDDDRWVGNVGWRQNEQTYDAVRLQTDLGVDELVAQYIFAWEVNRIFGDQGPPDRRDFGTKTHLMNLSYDASEELRAVAFVYMIDANDPFAAFGSNSFGMRLTGTVPISNSLDATYQASYAYQRDASGNPTDYDAHYYMLEGAAKLESTGTLAVGYEVLGSDNGVAVVVTPYATAHKFNGFADVFLDNGGPRGLRDLYVSLTPSLSAISENLSFSFTFHQFYDDKAGDNLGQEYDLVTTYQLNRYISFLYKFGYFDGGKNRSPNSTRRSIVQTTLKF